MSTIPRHCLKSADCKTSREFKQKKRKEIREIETAVYDMTRGLGYSPAALDAVRALDKIRIVKHKLSIKIWGR